MNLALLEKLVNINSDSNNSLGIKRSLDIICEYLRSNGIEPEIKGEASNPVLIAEAGSADDPVLLMGHVDTVFPENWGMYKNNSGILTGPGVQDMKSGLIMMLEILLRSRKEDSQRVILFINSDEEIGSAASLPEMKKLQGKIKRAYVFEGVKEDEGFITERKGIAEFHLYAEGIASHAGSSFYRGENAILKLNYAINDIISTTTALPEEITLNLGRIAGGGKLNIVPGAAEAHFDLRYTELKYFEQVEKIFKKYSSKEGFKLDYRIKRPPMLNRNKQNTIDDLSSYFEKYNEPFQPKMTGGCSDGNLLSSLGIPVIDGVGPRGGGDHTESEFTIEKSIYNRIEALWEHIIKSSK